jgi:hypothetical protein
MAFLEEARKKPKTRDEVIAETERRMEEAAEEEARRAREGEWWEP